jgi:hypothetical protein
MSLLKGGLSTTRSLYKLNNVLPNVCIMLASMRVCLTLKEAADAASLRVKLGKRL